MHKVVKIKKLDAVHCKIMDKESENLLLPVLSYKSYRHFIKKVRYGSRVVKRHFKTPYVQKLYDGRNKIFLTGFVPRIKEYCTQNEYQLDYISYDINVQPEPPQVTGIDFRDYQKDIILSSVEKKRGFVKAPTGSGKTTIFLGIISCFPAFSVLILCDKVSLLNQLKEEAVKRKINNCEFSTIQSFVNRDPNDYSDYFDMVIVDECHHLSGMKTMYAKVLEKMLAEYRYGFTATPPKEKAKKYALEGLIGPMIAEFTEKEAIEKKVISKPKLTLESVEFDLPYMRKYVDFYEQGIINNIKRNKRIIRIAKRRNRIGKTCLIMVKEIQHGENLLELANNLNCKFIRGETKSDTREKIKLAFNDKNIMTIIATAVWKEGIDIPTLDVVINAIGGKSEIQTLQMIGRGSRVTEDKTQFEIVDFLDSCKYLAEHSIERMKIYNKKGWLTKNV